MCKYLCVNTHRAHMEQINVCKYIFDEIYPICHGSSSAERGSAERCAGRKLEVVTVTFRACNCIMTNDK